MAKNKITKMPNDINAFINQLIEVIKIAISKPIPKIKPNQYVKR